MTLVVATAGEAMADLKPAPLFSDNMVIHRDTQAAVWGRADVGEKVSVSGDREATASTTADAAGKWMVKLKTPVAAGQKAMGALRYESAQDRSQRPCLSVS